MRFIVTISTLALSSLMCLAGVGINGGGGGGSINGGGSGGSGSGTNSYILPPATTNSLGGVIPDGTTITVDGTGKISTSGVAGTNSIDATDLVLNTIYTNTASSSNLVVYTSVFMPATASAHAVGLFIDNDHNGTYESRLVVSNADITADDVRVVSFAVKPLGVYTITNILGANNSVVSFASERVYSSIGGGGGGSSGGGTNLLQSQLNTISLANTNNNYVTTNNGASFAQSLLDASLMYDAPKTILTNYGSGFSVNLESNVSIAGVISKTNNAISFNNSVTGSKLSIGQLGTTNFGYMNFDWNTKGKDESYSRWTDFGGDFLYFGDNANDIILPGTPAGLMYGLWDNTDGGYAIKFSPDSFLTFDGSFAGGGTISVYGRQIINFTLTSCTIGASQLTGTIPAISYPTNTANWSIQTPASTNLKLTNNTARALWTVGISFVDAVTGVPKFQVGLQGLFTNIISPLSSVAGTTTNYYFFPVNPNTTNSITDVSTGSGVSASIIFSQAVQ